MNYDINSVDSRLRIALRSRIGSEQNITGAKELALKEWKTANLNAGQLAYCLFFEAVLWADSNVSGVTIPDDALNDNTFQMIRNICEKANRTHNNGSKTIAGAAIGSNFGWLGAAVGAVFGWAVGQNAANHDMESILLYANQAADYMCDVICNRIRVIEYQKPIY